MVSGVELDPFGGETNRSFDTAAVNQKQRYTTYERDGNGGDEAMLRRYERWHSRFYQPDPYDGSYDLSNPQSLNRYSYVGNDPVNFTDPTGLDDELGMYLDRLRREYDAYRSLWELFIHGLERPIPQPEVAPTDTNPGGGPIVEPPPAGTPQQGHCGLNPVTGQPGFQRSPTGVPGNLRPGVGGDGYYGARRPANKSGRHNGLDVSGQSGVTPVFAFYPGRVTSVSGSVQSTGGMGLAVTIDHGNGYTSTYGHLSSASVSAQDTAAIFAEGLGIVAGQVGVVGQSGNAHGQATTEAHVHFEIRRNGVSLDPQRFLNSPCPRDFPGQ